MYAWAFPTRDVASIARLIHKLGTHRYVRERDHRVHFSVDQALEVLPGFAPHAEQFRSRQAALDMTSRDPALWRSVSAEEAVAVLEAFWLSPLRDGFSERLRQVLREAGIPWPEHAPWTCSPEEPAHPELLLLDWELLPVDELDPEKHQGALTALEGESDPYHPSDALYQEGPMLSAVELAEGAEEGELLADWMIWSDGPYTYADYVLRGAARAAKLDSLPSGYRDAEV